MLALSQGSCTFKKGSLFQRFGFLKKKKTTFPGVAVVSRHQAFIKDDLNRKASRMRGEEGPCVLWNITDMALNDGLLEMSCLNESVVSLCSFILAWLDI